MKRKVPKDVSRPMMSAYSLLWPDMVVYDYVSVRRETRSHPRPGTMRGLNLREPEGPPLAYLTRKCRRKHGQDHHDPSVNKYQARIFLAVGNQVHGASGSCRSNRKENASLEGKQKLNFERAGIQLDYAAMDHHSLSPARKGSWFASVSVQA